MPEAFEDSGFEQLRELALALEPDPEFVAGLRLRLEEALRDVPAGAAGGATPAPGLSRARSAQDADERARATSLRSSLRGASLTAYLAVADARVAIDWYRRALRAELVSEPVVMPDGRIGHAELALGAVRLMLSDESPSIGVIAPSGRGNDVTLHLDVGDVDLVVEAMLRAGARPTRPPADHPYGRNGVVLDPFGHRWMISGPASGEPAPRHGDLAYASLQVADAARAAAFFGAVLGWRLAPGPGAGAREVIGAAPSLGLAGGSARPTLLCCYQVADLAAALAEVRRAGGVAGTPRRQDYGIVADCRDDQGVLFALVERPVTAASWRRATGGERAKRHGDLAYVTLEVVDSGRARAFYGAVLGWRAAPGRPPDGWQVLDSSPPIGLHGGHEQATGVPLYAVDDLHAALVAVQAAGGEAGGPQRQPYGIIASCSDDQGTRFWLGELANPATASAESAEA